MIHQNLPATETSALPHIVLQDLLGSTVKFHLSLRPKFPSALPAPALTPNGTTCAYSPASTHSAHRRFVIVFRRDGSQKRFLPRLVSLVARFPSSQTSACVPVSSPYNPIMKSKPDCLLGACSHGFCPPGVCNSGQSTSGGGGVTTRHISPSKATVIPFPSLIIPSLSTFTLNPAVYTDVNILPNSGNQNIPRGPGISNCLVSLISSSTIIDV